MKPSFRFSFLFLTAPMLSLGFSFSAGAESWHVYFGTGGRESRGIYRAAFDSQTGKLTPATLAAEIGSPGFLALHPDGTKLYTVANFDGGPGVAGYRIGRGGELTYQTQGVINVPSPICILFVGPAAK